MKRRFLKKHSLRKKKSKSITTPKKGDIYISKNNLRLYDVSKVSGSRIKFKTVHLIDKNPTLLLPHKKEERLSDFNKNYVLLVSNGVSDKESNESKVSGVKVGRWYCNKYRPYNYHMVVANDVPEGCIVLSYASCKNQSQKKVGAMQLVNQYEPVSSRGFLPLLPILSKWVWHSNFCPNDTSYQNKCVYLLSDYGDEVAISSRKNSCLCDVIDKSEFLLHYTRIS